MLQLRFRARVVGGYRGKLEEAINQAREKSLALLDNGCVAREWQKVPEKSTIFCPFSSNHYDCTKLLLYMQPGHASLGEVEKDQLLVYLISSFFLLLPTPFMPFSCKRIKQINECLFAKINFHYDNNSQQIITYRSGSYTKEWKIRSSRLQDSLKII